MLSVVLILLKILGSQAQHLDYKSVTEYVENLTHDGSSGNVFIFIPDGQDDLADLVLKKIMQDRKISVTIANSHLPKGKTV